VSSWILAPLGELLQQSDEQVEVQPAEVYKQITVRMWGNGVTLRGEVTGAEIASQKWNVARTGQFILSRIDARHGAFGIVPDHLDGAIVSNDFPVFCIDQTRLLPNFLHWLSRTSDFVKLCKLASEGTTNRVRLKLERFLASGIPLPPVEEQRRIVSRIETLAERITEARKSHLATLHEVLDLQASVGANIFQPRSDWIKVPIRDFCEAPQYGYTASAVYDLVGPHLLRITDIQSGQVNWDSVPYCECPNPAPYILQKGDLLFARTGATTGKSYLIDECPPSVFASYLIRLRVRRLATPEYLYCFFQTPGYWAQVADEKTGTGQPNVNGRKLANILVPIPSFDEQYRIVDHFSTFQTRLDTYRTLHHAMAAELDALLPSILDRAFRGEL
jgi:type I restriction enzyme S subunit